MRILFPSSSLIASLGRILARPNQTRMTGITGMVYRNIRSVSGLVGDGLDLLLKQFSKGRPTPDIMMIHGEK